MSVAEIYENLKYTSIYTFDKKIKTFDNDNVSLSKNKKSITQSVHPFQEKDINLVRKIQLK